MANAYIEGERELKLILDQAEAVVELWQSAKALGKQVGDAEEVIMNGEQENIALRAEIVRLNEQGARQVEVHRENRAATQAHMHNLTAERDSLVQALTEANQQIEQLKAAAVELEKAAEKVVEGYTPRTMDEVDDVEA